MCWRAFATSFAKDEWADITKDAPPYNSYHKFSSHVKCEQHNTSLHSTNKVKTKLNGRMDEGMVQVLY